MGYQSEADGDNAIAIGNGASALYDNSAAFGVDAVVLRANQFVFGTSANTYTMQGLVSEDSSNAQSGPLELVTVDANGNLAGDGGATVSNLETQIANNSTAIEDLELSMASGFAELESDLNDVNEDVARNDLSLTIHSRLMRTERRLSKIPMAWMKPINA